MTILGECAWMFWMPKQSGKLVLSSAQKEKLQQLIRAQKIPQGMAQRARVVAAIVFQDFVETAKSEEKIYVK